MSNADYLLITANLFETRALLNVFEQATGVKAAAVTINQRVYRNLGTVNGARVFHALTEQGSSGVGGAQQSVDKAIRALAPLAVIAVGIAFGVNERKQDLGDILLSKQLRPYDLQRVGPERIILRGDKPHASAWLINLFEGVAHSTWTGAKVRSGAMLTGESLVDNLDYRSELLRQEPDAIGGEMEGAGLYVACHEHKKDWIVIKSICDWGDGTINTVDDSVKETRQQTAAHNSAEFVLHTLQAVPFESSSSESAKPTLSDALNSALPGMRLNAQLSRVKDATRALKGSGFAHKIEALKHFRHVNLSSIGSTSDKRDLIDKDKKPHGRLVDADVNGARISMRRFTLGSTTTGLYGDKYHHVVGESPGELQILIPWVFIDTVVPDTDHSETCMVHVNRQIRFDTNADKWRI